MNERQAFHESKTDTGEVPLFESVDELYSIPLPKVSRKVTPPTEVEDDDTPRVLRTPTGEVPLYPHDDQYRSLGYSGERRELTNEDLRGMIARGETVPNRYAKRARAIEVIDESNKETSDRRDRRPILLAGIALLKEQTEEIARLQSEQRHPFDTAQQEKDDIHRKALVRSRVERERRHA